MAELISTSEGLPGSLGQLHGHAEKTTRALHLLHRALEARVTYGPSEFAVSRDLPKLVEAMLLGAQRCATDRRLTIRLGTVLVS